MLENYLTFKVIPSPSEKETLFRYYYWYNGNEMCDLSGNWICEKNRFHILHITRDKTPDYSTQGFEHLGTKLMIDTMTDLRFRLKADIHEVTGTLSSADNIRGNWKRSIPFYMDLPKWISSELPCGAEMGLFHSLQTEEKVEENKEWIRNNLDAFCQMYQKDLYFKICLQWDETIKFIPGDLPKSCRFPDLRFQ